MIDPDSGSTLFAFGSHEEKHANLATSSSQITREKSHPIHMLPGELLALVFLFYIEGTVSEFSQSRLQGKTYSIPPAYSWLRIRHVCRLWRSIGLHYPSLHTNIVLADPEAVKDQIRRSGRLPLSIFAVHGYYKLPAQTVLESCRIVFREAPRIRHVLFQYTASLNMALQSSEFSALELPDLRTITVNFRDCEESGILRAEQYTYSPFTRMQLPLLQSYACAHGTLRSHLFSTLSKKSLVHTLRCLDVRAVNRFGDTVSSTTFKIFDLLDQLSLLEELSLDLKFDPAFQQPGRRVILPHLRQLTLRDGYEAHLSALFLDHVVSLPDTHIHIDSKAEEINAVGIDALNIASRFRGDGVLNNAPIPTPKFAELDIVLWGASRVSLRLWNGDQLSSMNLESALPPSPILQWDINLSISATATQVNLMLGQIIRTLPLSDTVGLLVREGIRDHHFENVSVMESLIFSLDNIRVLGCEGFTPWTEISHHMQSLEFGLTFPRLGRLHLRRPKLDREGHNASLTALGKGIVFRAQQGELPALVIEIGRWPIPAEEEWTGEEAFLSSDVVRYLSGLTFNLDNVQGARFCQEMMLATSTLDMP